MLNNKGAATLFCIMIDLIGKSIPTDENVRKAMFDYEHSGNLLEALNAYELEQRKVSDAYAAHFKAFPVTISEWRTFHKKVKSMDLKFKWADTMDQIITACEDK